ncbi:MAG: protein kinase [Polyangiaceae bacterium]|nr:protein kinase [Polyangiaceae bacterium]MCL4756524.1 protein kinase [Myxococcales bacterium]
MSLRVGEVVGGRYRVDAAIGGGGFGAVYRATQLNLNRAVALKVLHPGLVVTDGALARFRREAELAQQLKSPNTVRVYDFGTTDHGLPFIAWEHLEGRPLDTVIAREGPMPPSRVAHVARQILKALMEAHAAGIVHRDIKPANIVLTDFPGEPDFVKVLDFGVAKTLQESGATMTAGATPVGTPSYMSPEQVRNEAIGPGTDLYALGLTMAELLAGRVVVQGRNLMDVFLAHSSAEPLALPPEVLGGPLGGVIQRATQKSPALRYGSAAEMLMDLERAQSGAGPQALAATFPGHGSLAPPTPVSPYAPGPSTPPHTGGAVQVITQAPATRSGAGIAIAVVAGIVALGAAGVVVAAVAFFLVQPSSTPRAGAGPGAGSEPPAAGEPTELGARSGKGFDGIGATTIGLRIKPAGWHVVGEPIKNIEGTFTSSQMSIQRGTDKGTVTLYRFDDLEEAKKTEPLLRQKLGVAVERESAAILEVLVPQNEAEAKKLLGAIKGS